MKVRQPQQASLKPLLQPVDCTCTMRLSCYVKCACANDLDDEPLRNESCFITVCGKHGEIKDEKFIAS